MVVFDKRCSFLLPWFHSARSIPPRRHKTLFQRLRRRIDVLQTLKQRHLFTIILPARSFLVFILQKTLLTQSPIQSNHSIPHNMVPEKVSTIIRCPPGSVNKTRFHKLDNILSIYIPRISCLSVFKGVNVGEMVDRNNKKNQKQFQRLNY